MSPVCGDHRLLNSVVPAGAVNLTPLGLGEDRRVVEFSNRRGRRERER